MHRNNQNVIPHSHKKKPEWPQDPDSAIWGNDLLWIIQYDNIMRHPGGKHKGCKCPIHRGSIDGSQEDVRSNATSTSHSVFRKPAPATPRFPRGSSEDLVDNANSISRSSSIRKRVRPTLHTSTPISGPAGAVDENVFRSAFYDVPSVQIYGGADLKKTIKTIVTVISKPDEDWEKRVDALKKVRSVVIADVAKYPEFTECIKMLEIPMMEALKDLRSQVVREACITISFLAENLKTKFNFFSEVIISNVIILIQNSAKIMSTSALTALRFIIESTTSSRVLIMLVNNLTSKSKEIRRAIFDTLNLVLNTWPISVLEKRHSEIGKAIKNGIADADPEARSLARKAFLAYKSKFSEKADELLKTLDQSYQKMLGNGTITSSYGSNSSLTGIGTRTAITSARSPLSPEKKPVFNRSNSAVDPYAVKRANVRAQYAMFNRMNAGSTPKVNSPPPFSPHVDDMSRSRSRAQGYTRSQPGSRSASPSSHQSYLHQIPIQTPRRTSVDRGATGIPFPLSTTSSRDPSRETSPTRLGAIGKLSGRSRLGHYSSVERPPKITKNSLSSKMLVRSKEAERILATALSYDEPEGTRFLSGEKSDESETSSISSEAPAVIGTVQFSSFQEMLTSLTSPAWEDKKEALASLQEFLEKSALNETDLVKVTEIFSKMFLDSQIKGHHYIQFMGTVRTLILRHKHELNPWLYSLISKLFMKLGMDNLPSVEKKVNSVLLVVQNEFSNEHLINAIFRFIVDPTQTHNTKVRIETLQYLTQVCLTVKSAEFNPSAQGKDPTAAVLSKVVKWMDGMEVRPHAQKCFIELFHLNTPYITEKISQLKKSEQDVYTNVVQNMIRRGSSGTPSLSTNSSTPEPDKTLSEGIQRSFHKTSAEIYSYPLCSAAPLSPLTPEEDLIEKTKSLSLEANGVHAYDYTIKELAEINLEDPVNANNNFIWSSCMKAFRILNDSNTNEMFFLVTSLRSMVKVAKAPLVATYFKKIIKIVMNILPSADGPPVKDAHKTNLVVAALKLMDSLVTKNGLAPHFAEFTELLITKYAKIIENREHNMSILSRAEPNFEELAGILPLVPTLPILQTFAFSTVVNLTYVSITGIDRLVKSKTKEELEPHLDSTINFLLESFNSEYTSVRKAVVFCIVTLHEKFGEEILGPYLDKLGHRKRKIINVYIAKRNS